MYYQEFVDAITAIDTRINTYHGHVASTARELYILEFERQCTDDDNTAFLFKHELLRMYISKLNDAIIERANLRNQHIHYCVELEIIAVDQQANPIDHTLPFY